MNFPGKLFGVVSLVLVVVAALAMPAPAEAARGGWVLLGERTVSDRVETDVIAVTAARGDFRGLKLAVEGAGVEFRHMTIHFANGGDQEVELRRVIPAGGESRVIDIRGRDRVIRSVEFRYDAQALGGRTATVKLFGRH